MPSLAEETGREAHATLLGPQFLLLRTGAVMVTPLFPVSQDLELCRSALPAVTLCPNARFEGYVTTFPETPRGTAWTPSSEGSQATERGELGEEIVPPCTTRSVNFRPV